MQCKKGKPVGGVGLPPRRSPESLGTPVLHVEEEGARSAARQLTLALLRVLPRLLAILATNREWQRAETLFGDLLAAVEAVAVVALLQTRQRVGDLVERFGFHLYQGELDIFLDVGLGALDRVQHFVELA